MQRLTVFTTAVLFIALSAFANPNWISPWGETEEPPSIEIIESSLSGFTVQITIHGFYSEEVENQYGEFQRIRLAEPVEPTTMDIGYPELPVIARLIEIPSTASADVSVLEGDFVEIEGFRLMPFQTPTTDSNDPLPFDYNPAAYQSSALYPAETAALDDPGVWRHLKVASLKARPMQYIPAENKLRVYRSLTVKVDFNLGAETPFPVPAGAITPIFDRMYREMVLNYDPAAHFIPQTDDVVGIKYLVIAEDSNAVAAIQPLVELRHAQGLRTEVRLPEIGFSTPGDFKAYIAQLYLSDGLEYVLMVGDPYLGAGIPPVPMYYWDYNPSNSVYSDSWYTCVVPGGDYDHYPELAIGRFACQYNYELISQIDKTMDYLLEYDAGDDWFERSLLVAHQEEYPLKYTQCKEEIRLFNYNQQVPVFTTIYGGAGGNNTNIVNYVNSTSCGLFNYRGHGTETTWPVWGSGSFTSYNINQMNNQDRLFILFDVCCSNNDIVNYGGNCLVESFMKADYAAVAVHGALEPSYTDPNHTMDKRFYRAIYDEGVTNIGYASNTAHIAVMNSFGSYGQDNFRMYLWQGDPAIDIWTHIPQTIEVTAPERVTLGDIAVEITVQITGTPLAGAMVCLQNEEVYSIAYSNSLGIANIEFSLPIQQPGEIELTVSGHNLAFYQETIPVGGGQGDLQGYVLSNQTSDSLAGAIVYIPYLELESVTDSTGFYLFSGIPALTYEVTAEYGDYLPLTVENVVVDSGEVIELDFPLLHSECNPDIVEINAAVNPGETLEVPFNVINDGDGALDYTVEITGEMAGANLYQRFYFNASSAAGDDDIYGVVFDGENFWATGAGDIDNNWLHKFDIEGNFIESIPQPQSVTEHGFYDICWNGQYYYSSESSDIICFDSEGNYISSIPTTLEIVKAIAFNPESERFFIGAGASDIREIDSLGNVVNTYNHELNITGLCWRGNDPDDIPLYIFSSEPQPTISRLDPVSREVETVGSIFGMPDEMCGGCWISEEVEPLYALFLGVIQGSFGDKVKGWQLARLFNYISIIPDSGGTIEPGASLPFTVTFDAAELEEDEYDAIIAFTHNGFGGLTEIPILLTVSSSGKVDDLTQFALPQEFKLRQNHPNPFNSETVLEFEVPLKSEVRFAVYDILGRLVIENSMGMVEPGVHRYWFDGSALASGIYFCRMEAGDFRTTVKMLLLK
ncbi:MAG: carboxypeptidase regulatory-like domain-containing protein [candidate division Zixibacteria bacterium]|nr:carboxypeptidase regulatory-like domain-containing protein [Candidatus Tariuqbacter arcticus]